MKQEQAEPGNVKEKESGKRSGAGSSCSRSPRSHRSTGICSRRNSLSKSLQNFFHRKHSYTIKQGGVQKGKKLFESINDASEANIDSQHLRRSSRARVWSVRNSFSKSPVETVSKDLLKLSTAAKVRKKNVRSRTCSYAFDVLDSFNKLLQSSGEQVIIKNQKKRSSCLQNTRHGIEQDNVEDNQSEDVANSPGDIDEMQDRSRLSSFGSSVCFSDTSVCGCSLSSCFFCNRDRSDSSSIATDTDISTSYWDLRLPTESPLLGRQEPRRYSLDVATEHQITFGSPDVRSYLAKRRLSEQPSLYRGQNRMSQYSSWQDKFLNAMNNDRCFTKQSNDITEFHNEEQSYDEHREGKRSIDIPRVHRMNEVRRSTSACAEIRRSKSTTRRHSTDEKELPSRTHLQRSRSVDSSSRRRLLSSKERRTSRSPTCQFAFSDIESSEESESTQDPKESSSEDRQHSSLNDTSSLSACSMSGSSSNERNTPAVKKRSISDNTEHVSDDTRMENVDFLYTSIEGEYSLDASEKETETVIERSCNEENFSEKAEYRKEEIDRNTCIKIYSENAIKHEEVHGRNLEQIQDSFIEDKDREDLEIVTDAQCNEEMNKNIVLPQECEDAKANIEVVADETCQLFDEDSEKEDKKEDGEFAIDNWGTDVDASFEEQKEAKGEYADLSSAENDMLEENFENTTSHEIIDSLERTVEKCEKLKENTLETSELQDLDDVTESIALLFDGDTNKMRESQISNNSDNNHDIEVMESDRKPSNFDIENHTENNETICPDIEDEEKVTDIPEIDDVLNYFDSVLHDELDFVKEVDKDSVIKSHYLGNNIEDDDTIIKESNDMAVEEYDRDQKLNRSGNFEQSDAKIPEQSNVHKNVQYVKTDDDKMDQVIVISDKSAHDNDNSESIEMTDEPSDEIENSKEFGMTDESVQVGNTEQHDNLLEFRRVSLEEILFSSGRTGTSPDHSDNVDDVFEAINREVSKEENKDKDMMVMFLVGGELKVLRRSGTLVNGSHGDVRQPDFPSMTRKEHPQQNGSRDYVFQRTVHDINRGRPKSAIIVTRSQSFNGMANQQVVMGGRRESPQGVVLGESFRHHRGAPAVQPPRAVPGSRGAVGFSFKKSPKVPKVPRPNRALLMFQSVKRGIREFIEATKEDIDQLQHRETDLTSTAQGRLHEADKQIKSAERYLKRLEFHLAKLDELHEFYLLQQQLREGVRTMHRAYVTSPGNQSHSLSNVKYGYKECTQTMCNIEAQLEAMMGTFNCKLKGMAGFARLCPGDVFEVTVRHGTQKWKTKGRIEKTGNQKWDIPEFNFKAVVGDIFNIKGLEVRAFKSVLLGQKSCETKDLFSANPQLMTVSINVNGSLKLSIVITWNPLDGVDESFAFLEAPQKPQGTPRRRPVSVIALNGQYDDEADGSRRHSNPVTIQQTKDDNFILRTNPPSHHVNNVTSYHGLDSPHVSSRISEHMPDAYRQTGPLYSQTSHHIQAGFHSSPALPAYGENDSDRQLPHPPTQNSAFSNTLPSVLGHLHFPSVSPHAVTSGKDEEENSVLNIEDVLHTLTSSLEDYHGQYTELQKLEDLIKFAQKLIRKQFRSSSRSSSISVSIESALEAFDFLDTEEAFEEPKSPTDNMKASFDDMLCSPESTAKTGDSGIESLAQRLSEDTQLGSSLGSSPVPPSTGNEEVDQCLMYHLTYCERLLENLGAFGPLKCREIYALDKLQKQCTIIESLLKLAKAGPHVELLSVMSGICEEKSLREFWVKCTDQNTLYIHPDRLLNMLEQKYSSVIAEKHMIDPVKVCQHVITRVLDIPDYEAERGRSWFVLTLHQFMLYFNEEGGLKHLDDVAQEMKLVEKLTTGNPDIVIKAILTLRDTLPSSPCLKVIGMLLVTMDEEVKQCTLSYLNLIQKKKEDRQKALITFVEGLEDRTPEIRSGACAALAILEATESMDQLVYLWQSDSSPMVQRCAKDALLKLGDEGRKAFEDAQLSKHGFQGIQVHK